MANSDSAAALRPGTYLFEVPDSGVSVYLSLEVIDNLQQDVMRGFGAVPKRGAEVGGILLGSTTHDGKLVVNVEEYEMAPIEYKRGPSYQLSPPDLESFQATLDRVQAGPDPELKPIGFFRSHTREAPGLVQDDLEFLEQFFPDPDTIVLLIKPHATRVSTATFLVRRDGAFETGAPLAEFPLRRKDLAPGDHTPPKRPRASADVLPPAVRRHPPREGDSGSMVRPMEQSLRQANAPEPPHLEPSESEPETRDYKDRRQSGWVWVPLSFIFLLLGVLLGFQAAVTLRPQTAAGNSDPFNLQLNISKEGDNLNVRWDRQSRAIRTATRGVLIIVDGIYNKTVELDPNQLQTGTVVYRHNSGEVRFRLEVYPGARDMLVETVDWKQ